MWVVFVLRDSTRDGEMGLFHGTKAGFPPYGIPHTIQIEKGLSCRI